MQTLFGFTKHKCNDKNPWVLSFHLCFTQMFFHNKYSLLRNSHLCLKSGLWCGCVCVRVYAVKTRGGWVWGPECLQCWALRVKEAWCKSISVEVCLPISLCSRRHSVCSQDLLQFVVAIVRAELGKKALRFLVLYALSVIYTLASLIIPFILYQISVGLPRIGTLNAK